ncbi:hypothetical protein [Streptomyces sp. KL116D]|uniref:hypothetical protein n=1 Tax=Streptomyces sp. KL116D TaxID=3045152 RepID=UPI0035567960
MTGFPGAEFLVHEQVEGVPQGRGGLVPVREERGDAVEERSAASEPEGGAPESRAAIAAARAPVGPWTRPAKMVALMASR